jgi:prepilin-type N-terminal cleavage/methylation domain-containing protein
MKNSKLPQAFTLVELIVVVSILAILATIGFVSYSGYLVGVRDTSRIAQLSAISDGLEMYRTRKDLPNPENSVEVKINGVTIAYQGYMGKANLETIEYSKEWMDPKDGIYYSYYVTKDKKYFQLMWFLEEEEKSIVSYKNKIIGQVYASIDYSERFSYVIGKKLGILTDEENTPIQEIEAIQTATLLDVATATGTYIAHLGKDDIIKWTGGVLPQINPVANCKRILQIGMNKWDGVYSINPTWTWTIDVYCDMTTDWGGWTLVLKADGTKTTFNYSSSYWTTNTVLNENYYNFDNNEFKSQLYNTSKFSWVLLILKNWTSQKYISVNISKNSLLSLFNSWYTQISIGKEKWLSLGNNYSLQPYCNQEWFNTQYSTPVRFWISSNNENACSSNDSNVWIWLSASSTYNSSVWSNCWATLCSGWNIKVESFGYLFIR